MPLYEYQCEDCDHRFEVIQKYADPPLEKCPKCGGPVRKLFSSPAIQFKGSGWYITDYARKGSAGAGSDSDGGAPADSASKAEKTDKGDTTEKSGKAEKAEKSGASSADSSAKPTASSKAPADPAT
jgi:putative FmdB family regulatory protein